MFAFLKNRSRPKSEEEKRAEALPNTKKVQFIAKPLSEAQKALDENIRAVLDFEPVNYYASKERFLLCVLHYSDEYDEILLELEYVVNDVTKEKSRLWSIDRELMRDILRKFGQNIP